MEETSQKEEGINLMDVVRLLLGKIKLLILVLLACAVVGGGFAVWRNINVKYYGTKVEFYVNPEKLKDSPGSSDSSQYGVYGAYGRHVMDNIVKLLDSESFTEQLILDKKPEGVSLADWQKTSDYKKQLNRFSGHVSYSYLDSNVDSDEANNLARSFIYVKISVLNDEELAKEIYESVIKVVPEYVEANMPVPTEYEGTNCQRISRTDEVSLLNPNQTVNQAIKYAVLFALAGVVVACIIIIVVDRSDKRLRDEETIVRMFNVPVLGVVPTIDNLVEQTTMKQNERRKKKYKTAASKKAKVAKAAKAEKPAKPAKPAKPVKEKKQKPERKPEVPTSTETPTEATTIATPQPVPEKTPQSAQKKQTDATQRQQNNNNNRSKKAKNKKGNRR